MNWIKKYSSISTCLRIPTLIKKLFKRIADKSLSWVGTEFPTLADAQEAIVLNPESATGYMLLGRSHQLLENYMDAIFAYEQASTLAETQGNSRLAATARVNLGFLLQQQRAQ